VFPTFIHFLGFRSDVPNLLQAPDCWVAPTGYETYGLAVDESLCFSLPALVSANAGVAERYLPQLQDLLISNCENIIELVTQLQKWGKNRIYYSNLVSSFAQ
jgi:glycosyltransferase involved in cell wall biosynthesis